MKFLNIFLLILIIIGIGLLFTRDTWVPKLVDEIIARDHVPPPFVLERPVVSTTTPLKSVHFLPKVSQQTLSYGEVMLKVGKTAMFDDGAFSLIRVFDDSRCPDGVACVWAGTVKAEIRMGMSTSSIELGKTVSVGTDEVTLLSVNPSPKQGVAISAGDYEVTLRVAKKSVGTPLK